MKKTIIILILVVYVASIALVNFLGTKTKVTDGTVYVTSITCETITTLNGENKKIAPYSFNEDNVPIFIFRFDNPTGEEFTTEESSIAKNPNVIQLNLDVLPHNAETQNLKYVFDDITYKDELVYKEEIGAFVVIVPYSVFYITIKATDGSNTSTTVGFVGFEPDIYDELF